LDADPKVDEPSVGPARFAFDAVYSDELIAVDIPSAEPKVDETTRCGLEPSNEESARDRDRDWSESAEPRSPEWVPSVEHRSNKTFRLFLDAYPASNALSSRRVDDPPSRDLRGTACDRSRGGFEGAPPAPPTEASRASKRRDPATPSAKRRSSRAARRTSAAASADLGNRASRCAADREACAWRLAALSATRFATRSISSPG
jgi:hypothetical protein